MCVWIPIRRVVIAGPEGARDGSHSVGLPVRLIVSPSKAVFFVATALTCSGSLYGAGLTARNDPLTKLFVGVPNRLTLPLGFPANAEASATRGPAPQAAQIGGVRR